jgi:hypothetical protein
VWGVWVGVGSIRRYKRRLLSVSSSKTSTPLRNANESHYYHLNSKRYAINHCKIIYIRSHVYTQFHNLIMISTFVENVEAQYVNESHLLTISIQNLTKLSTITEHNIHTTHMYTLFARFERDYDLDLCRKRRGSIHQRVSPTNHLNSNPYNTLNYHKTQYTYNTYVHSIRTI